MPDPNRPANHLYVLYLLINALSPDKYPVPPILPHSTGSEWYWQDG